MSLTFDAWLEQIGLAKYSRAFADAEVDLSSAPVLTDADLRELGLPLGPRRKFLTAAASLPGQAASARRPAKRRDAERRLLSVLFCDLVDSTGLSRRLDPEDLHDVLRRYQDAAAGAVGEFGGHVAKFMGDGVLAYFGWPQAHEDQAEQAIRAGLRAVERVRSILLEDGVALRARVGIATGRVIVGDLVGEHESDHEAVVGETPNLAARLQEAALPGQVLIAPSTRRLIGSAFELSQMDGLALKGFPEPVTAWSVIGQSAAESRFEAAYGQAYSRLVGRDREISHLLKLWERARQRQGQVVLLSGEAGIGKSRLTQAMREAVSTEPHYRLRFQCSPLHCNSAFHPIIRRIERASGFEASDSDVAKLDKLVSLLRRSTPDTDSVVPLFATLMSVPTDGRYREPELDAQTRRERTIEAFVQQVLALADMRPVLFVLEDAHWIDPSTSAFLTELIPRIANAAVLMVVTFRVEFQNPWAWQAHLTSMQLGRLGLEESAAVVANVAGPELSPDTVAHIVARADGIPLYLEELTKAVAETGAAPGGTEADGNIPGSLEASLAARLDRLGDAKELAQIGAVVGRSFSPSLIAAVAGKPLSAAIQVLDRLVEAGLASRTGAATAMHYSFKHALVQDVAYKSLLRRRRAMFHGRVAEQLIGDGDAEYEQVAHHLSMARLQERAVEYWLRAGQRAAERSAHVEAIAHLRNGLKELESLSPSQQRDEREFALRIALGVSLLTVEGWSAPGVAENYERAQDLSLGSGDVRKLFTALRGLANVYFLKGEVRRARSLVERLRTIARDEGDGSLLLQADLAFGMCCLFMGEFSRALEHLQRANALYDRAVHHELAYVNGTDPAVVGQSAAALAHWLLGEPECARNCSAAALELAREMDHPFSLAYAQSLAATLHQFRHDHQAVLEQADAAISTARRHDYPYWLGWAEMMKGWAMAATGDVACGMEMLTRGLETYEATGALQIKPYALTLLAEMHGWAGDPEQGARAAQLGFGDGNASDVSFFEVDALRVRGKLAHLAGEGDARGYLVAAIDLARTQHAMILGLRAAVDLAASEGNTTADRDLVRAFLDEIPDGDAEPDLRAARLFLSDTIGQD